MFNQTPNQQIGSALTSSHAMSGWVTPHLQSVRPSCEGDSLLNQEASNAFPLFHYWKPCPIERCYSTATLNFSSYLPVLPGLCLSLTIQGIRAVSLIVKNYRSIFIFNLYHEAGYASSPDYKSGVSATPAPHGVL